MCSPANNPGDAAKEKQPSHGGDEFRSVQLATLDCQQLWCRVLIRQRCSTAATSRNEENHDTHQPKQMTDKSHGAKMPNDSTRRWPPPMTAILPAGVTGRPFGKSAGHASAIHPGLKADASL